MVGLDARDDGKDVDRHRQQQRIGDLFVLLEHSHVYTNGRGGRHEHLLVDQTTLVHPGARYLVVDRGGDLTFHGPDPLVGYAVIDLDSAGPGVRTYVRGLEQVQVRTVAHFGIEANIKPGYTGVWVWNE